MRIGPKMQEAADFVNQNPGCSMLKVAEAIGPNGSRYYGYRAVHRALKAGLIRDRGHEVGAPNGQYRLYPINKAEQNLNGIFANKTIDHIHMPGVNQWDVFFKDGAHVSIVAEHLFGGIYAPVLLEE